MIDLSTEEILTLPQASQLRELRRNGKPPHLTTVLRWALRGCHGVKLETARSGGRRVTSVEAVHRFLDRINVGTTAGTTAAPSLGHERAELLLRGARI